MKRILSILLAFCMLLSLTACRSSEDRKTMRRQMDLYNGKTQPDLPAKLALHDGTTLEEQVVYDDQGITITVFGIYEDEYGYRIPLTVKNDSGDPVFCGTGSSISFTVNGYGTYMNLDCSASYYVDEVCNHGMEVFTLVLDKTDLPLVVTPGQIVSQLYLNDTKTHQSTYVSLNLTTSAGEGENRQPLSDTPFWTDGALDLYLLYVGENYYSRRVYIYGVNRSASDYYLSARQGTLSVNGTVFPDLYVSFSGFVDGESQKVFQLDLSKYELEDAGILPGTPLETIDFTADITKYAREIEESELSLHIDLPEAAEQN